MAMENQPNQAPSYQNPQGPVPGKQPGQGAATGSLVCGIIAVVLAFFGYGAIVSLILGIVGLVMASKAKKEGFSGGLRTAGFVLSIIGLVFGAIGLIGCVACAGVLGAASMSGARCKRRNRIDPQQKSQRPQKGRLAFFVKRGKEAFRLCFHM